VAIFENVTPDIQRLVDDPLDGMTSAFQAGIKIFYDNGGGVGSGH